MDKIKFAFLKDTRKYAFKNFFFLSFFQTHFIPDSTINNENEWGYTETYFRFPQDISAVNVYKWFYQLSIIFASFFRC